MINDKFRCCFAAAVLACGPFAAWAQATEYGAEDIRAALQEWVDGQLAASTDTEAEVEAAGPVTVTPDGDVFQATLPAFDVRMADGTSFTVKPVPIDLEPLDNGWFDTSWRLPDEIVIYDAAGAETARFAIAGQSGDGVFAPEIRNFMSMRFALDGIALTAVQDDSGLFVDRLTGRFTYDETAAGVYDQPGAFSVEGVQVTGPAGLAMFDLGRLAVTTAAGGVRLAEMAAFTRSFEEAMTGLDDLPPEAAEREAAIRMVELFEQTPDLLSSLEFSYDLSGLAVENEDFRFGLPSGTLGLRASGLDTPTARIGLSLGFADMALDPAPAMADVVPTSGQVDLALVDLPTEELLDAVIAIMASGAAPEFEAEQAITSAFTGVQEALSAGGSRMVVDDLTLANATASLAFEGDILADTATAFGFQGGGTMTIANLAGLIERAQTMPEAQGALGALIFLQGLGAPETAADGGIIHRYDLEMTAAGEMLVNGVDMAGLAGAAGKP